MAREPLKWTNLPTDGMPKPIATAYDRMKASQEEFRIAVEKHLAKKLELDLEEEQVIVTTKRGVAYAVKKRGTATEDGSW